MVGIKVGRGPMVEDKGDEKNGREDIPRNT